MNDIYIDHNNRFPGAFEVTQRARVREKKQMKMVAEFRKIGPKNGHESSTTSRNFFISLLTSLKLM